VGILDYKIIKDFFALQKYVKNTKHRSKNNFPH